MGTFPLASDWEGIDKRRLERRWVNSLTLVSNPLCIAPSGGIELSTNDVPVSTSSDVI